MQIDDSVVRWAVDGLPATADEALIALSTRPLLLVMHGFGSFEGDLIELANQLPKGLVVASPRAPLVAPHPIENGYAWWNLRIGDDGLPLREAPPANFEGSAPHTAALTVLEWIDGLDARVRAAGGSGLGHVIPMGFSQGGCMATSLLRLRPSRFVCAINCSGFVAPGMFVGDEALGAIRPPLFWGRDPEDPIIDSGRIDLTAQWSPLYTELEAHLYEGIAHGIGAEELSDISAFIAQHLSAANAQ